jgi:hypothetical protein
VILSGDYDIIALCETFLRENEDIEIDGYSWVGHNRSGQDPKAKRGSGGVGFLIRKELLKSHKCVVIDSKNEGILWIRLTNNNGDSSYVFCVCYLPPADSSRFGTDPSDFYTVLREQVHSYQNDGALYMCGDFNSRTDDNDYIEGVDSVPSREILDTTNNAYGHHLIDFLIDCNMCMLNGRVGHNDFTYVSTRGKSVIDYVLVPYEQLALCDDFSVVSMSKLICDRGLDIPDKIPDHSVLEWSIEFADPSTTQCPENTKACGASRRYRVSDIPSDFLNDDNSQPVLQAIERIEQELHVQKEVNQAYYEFTTLVTNSLDDVCGTNKSKIPMDKEGGKQKTFRKPYWTCELQQQWNNACLREREWLRCKQTNKKRCLREKYCFERKRFDKLNRKYKRAWQVKEQQQLLDLLKGPDSREFWKSFGKMGISNDRKQHIPMEVLSENGDIISDIDGVLNKWKSDYEHLYNDSSNPDWYDNDHLESIRSVGDNATDTPDTELTVINSAITREEVQDAVSRAKLRKAAGVDDIPAEALKNSSCIDILYRIINHCFNNGCVPDAWRYGIINPIVKPSSTDLRQPLSYRGITLLSVPCKIYCDILNRRLSTFIEEGNLLVEEQNGFRKQRSCIDHLYSLHSIVNNRKVKRQSTFACFVDMKKAFDNVNRDCLWYKVKKIGVHGNMLNAIQSLYEGVHCAVRVNGLLTPWFKVPNGVKQGCMMSPTLFALYIDDLARDIKSLNCGINIDDTMVSILLYADDIVLLAPTEEKLQCMLDKMHEWCRKWRLELNKEKTKVLHFRTPSTRRSNFTFKCGDITLDYAESYKYLGMWLDEHLNYKQAVRELAKSASRAFSALCTKSQNVEYTVFTALYKSLVQPILSYGAGIWGVTEHRLINTVQNRACRYFLGASMNTSNIATRGDMGWTSCVTKQRLEVYRLWLRLTDMSENRLPHIIHTWSMEQSKSWEKKVCKLTNTLQLNDLVSKNSDFRSKLCDLKQKLFILDEQQWFTDLWNDKGCINGNKLRTYRLFKKDLCPEPYVTCIMPRYHRKSTIKLRACSLPLAIEAGRYAKPPIPLANRVCPFCPSCVEDETHFIVDCSFYYDLTYDVLTLASFYDASFFSKSSVEKYVFLMQNVNTQQLLARKIYIMFKRRILHV